MQETHTPYLVEHADMFHQPLLVLSVVHGGLQEAEILAPFDQFGVVRKELVTGFSVVDERFNFRRYFIAIRRKR